ncbi:MAG: nucleoside hydrolase [Anaerolineaceae bacterium]|nr:nucleoside hydrolase [Anaerolineaceae bacterium]
MAVNNRKIRIVIDTDAGIDDAEAILMALGHPHVIVEAITTVTGNIQVEQVNRNVQTVLDAAGKVIPVYSGAGLPLVEPWVGAGEFHLNDGLGDWEARPPCSPKLEAQPAAEALVRLARENPGELTLVALGPMTNLALAIRLDPAFAQNIGRLVFMGGAAHAVGNTDRMAVEFNIGADPEAAHIVLNSFPRATMLDWEVTLSHPIPWAQYDRLCALPTALAGTFRGITGNVTRLWRDKPGSTGHLLPDPLAMAVALEPELILEQESRYVTVELEGRHTRGQTVVNYTLVDHGDPNVQVVKRVQMDGVLHLYEQMLCSGTSS